MVVKSGRADGVSIAWMKTETGAVMRKIDSEENFNQRLPHLVA
jgi:hypothetical protein